MNSKRAKQKARSSCISICYKLCVIRKIEIEHQYFYTTMTPSVNLSVLLIVLNFYTYFDKMDFL